MRSVSPNKSRIKLPRKSGACAIVSMKIGARNLCSPNDDLDCAYQAPAVEVRISVDPAVNGCTLNAHFSVRISKSVESVLRCAPAKLAKLEADNLAGRRGHGNSRSVPHRGQDGIQSLAPLQFNPPLLRKAHLLAERWTGLGNYGWKRLCSEPNHKHYSPLARRVVRTYSTTRAVNPARRIGSLELGDAPRVRQPSWRGFLWSGASRASSGAPLAPSGTSNRGASGHPFGSGAGRLFGATR